MADGATAGFDEDARHLTLDEGIMAGAPLPFSAFSTLEASAARSCGLVKRYDETNTYPHTQ